MNGYNYFVSQIHQHHDRLQIARIKNGFSQGTDSNSGGGYRDIKMNIIFKNKTRKLNMIGEIQFLLLPFLKSKKKSHKLYSILRRQAFYQLITNPTPTKTSTSNKANVHVNVKKEFEIVIPKRRIYDAVGNEKSNILSIVVGTANGYKRDIYSLTDGTYIKTQRSINVATDDNMQFYTNSDDGGVSLLYTISSTKGLFSWTLKNGVEKQIIDNTKILCFVVDKFDRIVTYRWGQIELRSMKSINKVICRISIGKKSNEYTYGECYPPDYKAPLSIDETDKDNKQFACIVSLKYSGFWLLDFINEKSFLLLSTHIVETHSCEFIGKQYVAIGGKLKGGKKGGIEIWDKLSKNSVRLLTGFISGVNVIHCIGSIMYAFSFKGELIAFDISNNFESKILDVGLHDRPKVSVTENRKYLIVAGKGCEVFTVS